MRLILSALCLLLALPAAAEIYSYTDEHGNKVYTNRLPQGVSSQPVELTKPNLIPAPAGAVPAARPAAPAAGKPAGGKPEAAAFAGYTRLEVTGAPNGGSLRSNTGDMVVGINITPPLQPSHQLALELDGHPVEGSGRDTAYTLTGLDRGQHRLQAVVTDDEGVTLMRSEPVVFNLLRATVPR